MYHQKYIKYKSKYQNIKVNSLYGGDSTDSHGKIDNGIYYETRGKYNGCTIVLFSPGSAYDWDHETKLENGKFKTINEFNFTNELSKLTQIFMFDRPELAANRAIDEHHHSIIFPPIEELDFESRVKKIYDVLKKNNIKPPYVLIGHSVAAFDALVFGKMYPKESKAVILLDGTRHCESMKVHTEKRFENIERINMTDELIQKMVNDVIINPYNLPQSKRFEDVLAINNYCAVNSLVKYWDQVPDKLDHIMIVGLWAIWIINDKDYPNVPIERKYDEQRNFLKTMKEYHEILGKQNKGYYDSYFFFGGSHFLHHSNTQEVIDIIKKYI